MYVRLLKSLNRLNPRAWDFIQLTRMDKPIGIYLLLFSGRALRVAHKGGKKTSATSTLNVPRTKRERRAHRWSA